MVSVMDCELVSSQQERQEQQQQQEQPCAADNNRSLPPNSAVSQNSIELQISDDNPKLDKCALKLNLENSVDEIEQVTKSPLASKIRQSSLAHQTTLTSQVDLVENRKTLRDALYQGIFHRHRRTIFALGSFLRMLKSRNSQYNTIRSSSEGEDVDEIR